jgi:hypothetical protein
MGKVISYSCFSLFTGVEKYDGYLFDKKEFEKKMFRKIKPVCRVYFSEPDGSYLSAEKFNDAGSRVYVIVPPFFYPYYQILYPNSTGAEAMAQFYRDFENIIKMEILKK